MRWMPSTKIGFAGVVGSVAIFCHRPGVHSFSSSMAMLTSKVPSPRSMISSPALKIYHVVEEGLVYAAIAPSPSGGATRAWSAASSTLHVVSKLLTFGLHDPLFAHRSEASSESGAWCAQCGAVAQGAKLSPSRRLRQLQSNLPPPRDVSSTI